MFLLLELSLELLLVFPLSRFGAELASGRGRVDVPGRVVVPGRDVLGRDVSGRVDVLGRDVPGRVADAPGREE